MKSGYRPPTWLNFGQLPHEASPRREPLSSGPVDGSSRIAAISTNVQSLKLRHCLNRPWNFLVTTYDFLKTQPRVFFVETWGISWHVVYPTKWMMRHLDAKNLDQGMWRWLLGKVDFWWWFQIMFYFHPDPWRKWSNLTTVIFFRWV